MGHHLLLSPAVRGSACSSSSTGPRNRLHGRRAYGAVYVHTICIFGRSSPVCWLHLHLSVNTCIIFTVYTYIYIYTYKYIIYIYLYIDTSYIYINIIYNIYIYYDVVHLPDTCVRVRVHLPRLVDRKHLPRSILKGPSWAHRCDHRRVNFS